MSAFENDRMFATRRQFLAGTAAAAVALQLPRSAYASGFHKVSHGAFDITVVSDGFITLPAEVLVPDASPDERVSYLKRLHGDAEGAGVPSNIPLIRHGKDLILIDNGGGTNFQPSDGRLAENLKILGVSPENITKVVFTHVHPDHSGATTTADGKVLYRNAQYYVGEAEWTFWTDKDFDAHQPSALHSFAEGAKRDLFAVKDRLTIVKPGDEIISGMCMMPTRGHTPGHMSVEIAGDGNLLITGDACTSDVTFFEHPDWHFGFDTEPDLAVKNRQMLLDRAASEKIKLLGFHWTYPGVGYASRKGQGYQFVPA
jgi:glyoxylase-like metal-dependent hydrolase (beta-lactamase superfamily II)